VSTTYRIHPGIGVARVGDSLQAFFVGPEAPGVPASLAGPADPAGQSGKYKDGEQRIKRQGARFRIFEYRRDAAGRPTHIREITAADAEIAWEVHLVNRKSAATSFPEGGRRNSGVAEASLIIDAGAQTISGMNTPIKRLRGRFHGVDIDLGDLLTDESGRLIALGGFGRSRSVPEGTPLVDFANNDGWCDDISDGPVRATVRLHGAAKASAVDPAWLLVAPPDFAPVIENVVTLHDVVYAMMAKSVDPSLRVTDATAVSFTRDIYPILRRVSQMHFVSDVAAQGHGEGSFGDFASAVETLSGNTPAGASLRTRIFRRLRNPSGGGGNMPKLPEDTNPEMVGQSLTEVQYARMERWAKGTFDADWPGTAPVAVPLDRLPESERPQALDRAALEGCVGGPFFPGIEVGRIMLEAATYDSTRPFRINPRLEPGALTARMAVPWQADFHDCAFEEGSDWWPGQRPIHVMRGQQRAEWMPRNWTKHDLVEKWSRLGFVVELKTATKRTCVEDERHLRV
jgi:L-Lysine epsilon oxidase N-terminal/L-lysine epsilon oxidase C-terminal domain